MARKGDRNTEPLFTHLVDQNGAPVSLVDAALVLAGILDRAGFTEGTTRFGPIGGVRNDTPTFGDVAEDTGAAVRITKRRAFHVNLRRDDATGAEIDLQTLLEAIRDNTSDLEVNTDALEAKLDTLIARFPAASALGDNDVAPSVSRLGTYPFWFDGSTHDRARGDAEFGLDVDVTRSALPAGAATEATLASLLARFPAAAVLSDTTANPTLTQVAVFPHYWTGGVWQRARPVGGVGDGASGTGIAAVGGVGFNGTTWDRVRAGGDDADAKAAQSLGMLTVRSSTYFSNGTTWDRARVLSTSSDAASALGGLATSARLFGFNGTTFDRLRSGGDNADDEATVSLGALRSKARNYVWDGAGWDRTPGDSANGMDVDVTRSALPSGASTEATLASILTELQNLSHAEDAIHTSTDMGIMAFTVRKDTPSALASDGDYQPAITDANGRLHVKPLHSFAADRQGATRREATHQGQTASFLHYTVAGGTLKCRLIVQVRNTSTITAGVLHIRNGTTVAGGIVASLTIGTAAAGAVAPEKTLTLGSDAFPEHFTTGIFVEANAGTLIIDVHMVGIEE